MMSLLLYGRAAPMRAMPNCQRPADIHVRHVKRILNREHAGSGLEFNFTATATVSRSTEER